MRAEAEQIAADLVAASRDYARRGQISVHCLIARESVGRLELGHLGGVEIEGGCSSQSDGTATGQVRARGNRQRRICQHGIADSRSRDAQGSRGSNRSSGESGPATHAADRAGSREGLSRCEGEDAGVAQLQSGFSRERRVRPVQQVQRRARRRSVVAYRLRLPLKVIQSVVRGAAVVGGGFQIEGLRVVSLGLGGVIHRRHFEQAAHQFLAVHVEGEEWTFLVDADLGAGACTQLIQDRISQIARAVGPDGNVVLGAGAADGRRGGLRGGC